MNLQDLLLYGEKLVTHAYRAIVYLPGTLLSYSCSYESRMQQLPKKINDFVSKGFHGSVILTTYRVLLFSASSTDLKVVLRKELKTYSVVFNQVFPLCFKLQLEENIHHSEVFVIKLKALSVTPNAFHPNGIQNAMRTSSDGFLLYDSVDWFVRQGVPLFSLDASQLKPSRNLSVIKKHESSLAKVRNFNIFLAFSHVAVHFALAQGSQSQNIECQFVVSNYNLYYDICETYPSLLVIPRKASLQLLMKVAAYRSNNRFPVVTYYAKERPVIVRSSQPLRQMGTNLKGKKEDIEYLSLFTNEKFPKFSFFDARPRTNALGNQIMGKGWEEGYRYPYVQNFLFLDLENIHEYRDSFKQLRSAYLDHFKRLHKTISEGTGITETFDFEDDKFLFYLGDIFINEAMDDYDLVEISNAASDCAESSSTQNFMQIQNTSCANDFESSVLVDGICRSKWISHKIDLINAIMKIQSSFNLGNNIFIHCSDGWDRTSIICALVQILIEGECRTVDGFSKLITKDFHSFGHKFGERNSNIIYSDKFEQESSPIFLMFIECVASILLQNEDLFEFNEDFLIYLVFQSYNDRYIDFLFTCESEMLSQQFFERGGSVFENASKYKVREIDIQQQVALIEVSKVGIWTSFWEVFIKSAFG